MMDRMLLSIIVPVYNCAEELPECIHALLAQKLSDYEILIVDDGSTDRSKALCDALCQEAPDRIRVYHKANEGQGIARNRGLEEARGEYVAFADGDDLPNINVYHLVLERMIAEKAELAVCNMNTIYSYEEYLKLTPKQRTDPVYMTPLETLELMADDQKGVMASVCNKLYRRELLETHHIRFRSEREVISEDYTFNVEYLDKAEKIIRMDVDLYNYWMKKGSYTHRYHKEHYERLERLMEYLKPYRERSEAYETAIENRAYGFLKLCIMQEVYLNREKNAGKTVRLICGRELTGQILQKTDFSSLDRNNRILYYLIKWKASGLIFALYRIKKNKRWNV